MRRDQTYLVAGHKGQPDKVAEADRPPRRRRLKGARGRGTRATENPPVFGMIQRSGEVVVRRLDNVRQETIKPLIVQTVAAGNLINTDEHAIYSRLTQWHYAHKTVNHSRGEYARDEDGDGFHEIHVKTIESLRSLLRSRLRPHRGVSQDKLTLYQAFFEFVYNLKRRGKRLLSSLLGVLLNKTPETHLEPKLFRKPWA